MAYTKFHADWKAFPDTTTPITEAALDYIETGIVAAHSTGSPGYELGYQQQTSNVTVSATTEAAGTTVISTLAFVADGAAVMAEFFAPAVQPAAGDFIVISLFEGGTQIGRMGAVNNPATGTIVVPVYARRRFTPTAASHSYTITAYRGSANGTINSGSGGTGAYPPAFLRFTKV